MEGIRQKLNCCDHLTRKQRWASGFYFVGLFTAFLSITLQRWVVVHGTYPGVGGQTQFSYYVGPKAYTKVISGPLGDQELTGTLKSPGSEWKLYRFYQETNKFLDAGGDYVLGLGIFAILLMVAAVVLVVLGFRRKKLNLRAFAIAALFLAGTMLILAVLAYARQVSLGSAYIITLCIVPGLILAACVLGASFYGKELSKIPLLVGWLLLVAGLGVTIWQMSVQSWVGITTDYNAQGFGGSRTVSIGLKTFTVTNAWGRVSNGGDGKLSSPDAAWPYSTQHATDLDFGGNAMVGTGVGAIILLLAAAVLNCLTITGKLKIRKLQLVGVLLVLAAGMFLLAGLIVYAAAVSLGGSFILLFATPWFIWLSAILLFMSMFESDVTPGSVAPRPSTASKPRQTITGPRPEPEADPEASHDLTPQRGLLEQRGSVAKSPGKKPPSSDSEAWTSVASEPLAPKTDMDEFLMAGQSSS